MPSIFITGANRGIGLEFARQYAGAGWQVTASCRDPARADDLRSLAVEIIALDVAELGAVRALGVILAGRAYDIILNNAGVYDDRQTFGQIDDGDWEREFRINAMAPIVLAQTLLPQLLAGQRKLLAFLTSRMGSISDNGSGGSYYYRSSKAALNAAVKSLSIDLAPQGVSTLLLHPGWVKTAMGGRHATVDARDSVSGMRHQFDLVAPGQALRFVDFRGAVLPW